VRLALVSPRASREGSAGSPASGGYLYDARVAAELRALGHEVDEIATPLPGDHDRGHAAAELARALARYDGALEDELGYDLYASVNALVRRAAPHVRLVGLIHVPGALLSPSAEAVARERDFLRSVDAAIHVSQSTLDDTSALLGSHGPSYVARPGCDHLVASANAIAARTRPAAASPGALHVVSVGHLLPHKGVLELIDVLEALAASEEAREGSPAWRATLAGDDGIDEAYAGAVRARLARSPVGARITLLGRCTQARIADLLASADVFVTTSRYESHGLAAAEALAQGVPVVGWAAGGFRELVTHGHDGLLVAHGDVTGFAEALARLAREPELRETMAARALASRLPTWRGTARTIARVFSDLDHRRGPRAGRALGDDHAGE